MCISDRLLITALFLGVSLTAPAQTSDSLIVDLLRKENVTFSHENSVVPFNAAADKYKDMFAAIRQARHSVHLEYFNFRNDSIANALFDLLKEKAQEGVKVRALYDAFGNSSNNRPLKKRHVAAMRAKGVEIREFRPLRFPWIPQLVHRDHRKIAVIDGRIAYIGGMNVADYYIKGKKEIGSWRDMHCRLERPEVDNLQRIFVRMWNDTAGQNLEVEDYFWRYGAVDYFNGLKPDTTATAYRKTVGIIDREPHKTNKIMRQFYCGAIDSAQDSIKIVNPYFTLTRSIKASLRRALERGVRVEVMISENCDIPITPEVSFDNLHWLMKRGAEAYIYQGGFHHTKTIMVDGRFCTIGSCNLDARSLSFDFETNAVIVDKNTTNELCKMFNADKAKCFRLTEERWKTWRTCCQKTVGKVAKVIAPLL